MTAIVKLLLSLLLFAVAARVSAAMLLGNDDYYEELSNNTYFNPQLYDVMLTDLDYAKISNLSLVDFGFEHNSLTTSGPAFPIEGLVTYGRTIGGVILQHKKRRIQSFVVFDIGAPAVYLCDRTFRALGIDHANHANIFVHGHLIGVHRSSGHFREVNVIGASYFLENKLQFLSNYRSRKVVIQVAPILTEQEEQEL